MKHRKTAALLLAVTTGHTVLTACIKQPDGRSCAAVTKKETAAGTASSLMIK